MPKTSVASELLRPRTSFAGRETTSAECDLLAICDYSGKGIDDVRVELRARAAPQLVQRAFQAHGRAVGAGRSPGVVSVTDRDYACPKRYVRAGEAVRISSAVELLVT